MIEGEATKVEGTVKSALPPCDIPDRFSDCCGEVLVVMALAEVAMVTSTVWKLRHKTF